jgi:hypothetical protein
MQKEAAEVGLAPGPCLGGRPGLVNLVGRASSRAAWIQPCRSSPARGDARPTLSSATWQFLQQRLVVELGVSSVEMGGEMDGEDR